MNSYWELYVAYIDKCVRDNWINDIDPHHYEMEWNHFLPRCVFGDWPIGHYLTLKQHAIASALQTLTFRRNCMFGWHKQYLPEVLLVRAWPYFCDSAKKRLHSEKNYEGKSVRALQLNQKIHSEKNADGKSVAALRLCEKIHEQKDEKGRSIHGMRAAERLHKEKTEEGKSVHGMKSAVRLNEVVHAEKTEDGKSSHAVKINKISQSRRFKCLVTGKITTAGPLSLWQKARGIDVKLRVRVA